MVFTRNDSKMAEISTLDPDRDWRFLLVTSKRPTLHIREEDLPQDRGVNNAQGRLPLLDQSNIDRELAAAFEKLFGAIERVDQPERRARVRKGASRIL